jgi:vacuolar-type H+-ATPase subunit I/STV1
MLGHTLPWQVAAFFALCATVFAGVAIGLRLWSKATDTSNNVYEYGMWENYVSTAAGSFISNAPQIACEKNLYLSMKVTSLIGICFCFLALLVSAFMALKGGKKVLAMAATAFFCIAAAMFITCFSIWVVVARGGGNDCYGTMLENYDASFILMVFAAAFAFSAFILALFGLAWEIKKPDDVYEEDTKEEFYPVVEEYAAPQAVAYAPTYSATPDAAFYPASYPTATYSVPAGSVN